MSKNFEPFGCFVIVVALEHISNPRKVQIGVLSNCSGETHALAGAWVNVESKMIQVILFQPDRICVKDNRGQNQSCKNV
ncbi:MAG: hypothetical protein GHCLOJNM_02011 [bacterium]|nr:hypothetical protein [bacterium]